MESEFFVSARFLDRSAQRFEAGDRPAWNWPPTSCSQTPPAKRVMSDCPNVSRRFNSQGNIRNCNAGT
ncbi:MAG: hypothetical protein AAFX78_19155 [Cyanobacteria bacterium J06638_20]